MFFILRFIRGIFGVVFATQVLQVLEAVLSLAFKYDVVSVDLGKYFALLLIKTVVLIVSCFLFFWLRLLINKLYEKKHGTPHPALGAKKWNL
jgi:hypothetical protein